MFTKSLLSFLPSNPFVTQNKANIQNETCNNHRERKREELVTPGPRGRRSWDSKRVYWRWQSVFKSLIFHVAFTTLSSTHLVCPLELKTTIAAPTPRRKKEMRSQHLMVSMEICAFHGYLSSNLICVRLLLTILLNRRVRKAKECRGMGWNGGLGNIVTRPQNMIYNYIPIFHTRAAAVHESICFALLPSFLIKLKVTSAACTDMVWESLQKQDVYHDGLGMKTAQRKNHYNQLVLSM